MFSAISGHLRLKLLLMKTNSPILNLWVAAKILKTIKKVLISGSRNPAAVCWPKYPMESNRIFLSSGNCPTPRLTRLTSGPRGRRIFAAGNRTGQPSFQQLREISKPFYREMALPVAVLGYSAHRPI